MRPAGICKSHDLLTYISQSTDFGQTIKVNFLFKVESQDLLIVAT